MWGVLFKNRGEVNYNNVKNWERKGSSIGGATIVDLHRGKKVLADKET